MKYKTEEAIKTNPFTNAKFIFQFGTTLTAHQPKSYFITLFMKNYIVYWNIKKLILDYFES